MSDGAGGDVVQTRDEPDEGRLAAARAAHDGRGLARLRGERDVAEDGVLGARVAELHVLELHDAPRPAVAAEAGRPGSAGSLMAGSTSSTSWMRPPDAAARGIMAASMVAIITENRICMTYGMKAMRLPMCMAPLSTR